MSALECQHCGATIRNQTARFCEFCGTEVVREGVPRAQTRDEARKTRFEMLEQHPELQRWLEYAPKAPPAFPLGTILFAVPLLVVFVMFTMFFMGGVVSMNAPKPMLIIPLLILGVGGYGLISIIRRASAYRSAPLERHPSIIVDERSHVSGGGKNSSASTRYYATIEFAGRKRAEYRVGRRLAGQVATGDAGVAYIKHDTLVAFHRLAV